MVQVRDLFPIWRYLGEVVVAQGLHWRDLVVAVAEVLRLQWEAVVVVAVVVLLQLVLLHCLVVEVVEAAVVVAEAVLRHSFYSDQGFAALTPSPNL